MKQYIVDAFTNQPFTGNPAAVCVMDSWPSEDYMKKLAMENNLSETAFIVKEEQGYHLRWFTPTTEVELCGHATLASSYVILNFYDKDTNIVKFNTLSGELIITKNNNLYEMNFPTYELKEVPITDDYRLAFGKQPIKAYLGLDLIVEFENIDDVVSLKPDEQLLMKLPGRIQNATVLGDKTDSISRSFCPKLGIYEDPVCGSAHVQIASYYMNKLNKNEIIAYQASHRGGYLYCKQLENNRMSISGEATLISICDILV